MIDKFLFLFLFFWLKSYYEFFFWVGRGELKVSRKSEKLMDSRIVEGNGMIRYLLDAQSLLENCQMLIVKGNLAKNK